MDTAFVYICVHTVSGYLYAYTVSVYFNVCAVFVYSYAYSLGLCESISKLRTMIVSPGKGSGMQRSLH